MTSKINISNQKLLWLGVVLLFLAVVAFIFTLFKREIRIAPSKRSFFEQFTYVDDLSLSEDGKKDLLETLRFQRMQTMYQASYIDLVERINNMDTTKINTRNAKDVFKDYSKVREDYKRTVKKLDDYEKEYKLKCFSKMRSLILAVLYSDKHFKKRTTKFDPEKLIEIGALQEIPVCPRGGTYSIIYKDRRRLFSCSLHGILKN